MKVEIPQDLQNEIMNFIENNSKDDAEAFALVEEVYIMLSRLRKQLMKTILMI